jgi:hypothetical protein
MPVEIQFFFANIPSLLFLGNRHQAEMATLHELLRSRNAGQYVATVATPRREPHFRCALQGKV